MLEVNILYCFTIPICKFLYKTHCRMRILFSACLGCKLVPIVEALNEDNLCVGCQHKKRCPKCWHLLPPNLFHDGDGDWCNACGRKLYQTGGATVYRALKRHVGRTRSWRRWWSDKHLIISTLQRYQDTQNTRRSDKHSRVCFKTCYIH